MRIKSLVLATATTLALAAPAPSKHLQKRSFKAASHGRAVNAVDDFNRVHQKYGDGSWTVVVVEGSYIAATTTSTSKYATGTGSPVYPSPTATPTYGNNTNEDGEVDAAPEDNESEYLSPVHIGGQLLNLNFDTGSADLWVFSTELTPDEIGSHSVYNHKKSESWSLLNGATWNISYGDGSGAGGIVGFDTVDVGGSTVDKQCVELAQYVSPAFVRDDNSDGLLGLSFSSISTVQPKPQKTFFENVKDDLSEPLFTADLEETNGKGTYEFGTIDKSKYKDDIHWTDVDNSDGWWQITVPRVKIGNNTTQKCTACTPMIADTGTSLLYLDQDIVDAYYNQIKGATDDDGLLAVPCDSKMPDLGLELGDGYFATLKGEEMIYMESPYISGLCWGGLQYSPGHIQIMGDVFLKQFFAVFDGGENLRFGVAEKN